VAERVDLDAIERFAREGDADTHPADPRRTVHGDDLLAMVAELRVARPVVDAARQMPRTVGSTSATRIGYAEAALATALARHDAELSADG